jgi:hydroxyacylglutathione hydrolase
MSDRKPSPFPVLLNNDVCSLIQATEDVYQVRFKNRAANAYLVRGKSRTIMIDVGLSSNYPALLACLHHLDCPPEKIDMVILSHEHLDHIGAAYHFGGRTIIAAHRLAANKIMLRDDFSMLRKMFNESNVPVHVDIWLEEGNLLDLGNFRLDVMYTPGHTSACISLFDQDQGLLFAADTLMPGGVMGGVFGSGSIADYIQSLERLKGLNSKSCCPGMAGCPIRRRMMSGSRSRGRTRCCRIPRNCSTRSTRDRISSRSCNRCATSTNSTTAEPKQGDHKGRPYKNIDMT